MLYTSNQLLGGYIFIMASLFRQMAGQARGGKEKTQEKILVSSEEREIGSLGKVAAASFFVEPSLCEFAAAAVCGTFHCKKNLCLDS